MNEADEAQKVQDLYLTIALNNRKASAPKSTGYCLNCNKFLPNSANKNINNLRWCDIDCKGDWERRQ
jgi:hypothetical protein